MKFEEGKILSSMTVSIDGVEKNIVFRFPRKEDAEGAMNTINSFVDECLYLNRLTKVTLEQEVEWITSILDECAEKKKGKIVVEYDGKYSGAVEVRHGSGETAHIANIGIAIKKELRGKGIGTRALQRAMEYGIEEFGAELFWLEVFTENTGAIKLYESLGFTKAGSIPRWFKRRGQFLGNTHMYKCVKNR